jgi:serine/threonine-protein kinase
LVVIKRLKPVNASGNTSTELIEKLFEKEASVLEDLGEHNSQITKLYSYFSDDGEFYLVQEYVQGKSLASLAPVSQKQAKLILSSLLNTLQYIHLNGIIHRDIKPENIIIRDSDNLPVLIDFGAVKETMGVVSLGSGSRVSSVVIGTGVFMSPEQSAGRSVFSSDLYALGLTIIYALTKKLPIEFTTSQLTGELDWQNEIPEIEPKFAEILDQATKIPINQRYSTAEAMYKDLHTLVDFDPANVAPTETIKVLPRYDQAYDNSGESDSNAQTVVVQPSHFNQTASHSNKSNGSLIFAILAGITILVAGLGRALFMIYQIKQTEAKIAQMEKEKQEAELKKIQAEQKVTEDENRVRELEQRKITEERERLAAEKRRIEAEKMQTLQSNNKPSAVDFIYNHYADLNS